MSLMVRESKMATVGSNEVQAYYRIQNQIQEFNERVSSLCISSIRDFGAINKRLAFDLVQLEAFQKQFDGFLFNIQHGLGTISIESDLNEGFLQEIKEVFKSNRSQVKGMVKERFDHQLQRVEQNLSLRIDRHIQSVKSNFLEHLQEKQRLIDLQLIVAKKLIKNLTVFLDNTLKQKMDSSREDIFGAYCSRIDRKRSRILNEYHRISSSLNEVYTKNQLDFQQLSNRAKIKIFECRTKSDKIFESFLEKFEQGYLTGAADQQDFNPSTIIDLLSSISSSYLDSTERFKSLAEVELNSYIVEIQSSLAVFLKEQDKELDLLLKKIETIKGFLEDEIEIVLQLIQKEEMLKTSPLVGQWGSGREFDESLARVYGNITRIVVNHGWWIDGFTVTHKNKRDAVQYGKGGGRSPVDLNENERIQRIVIGTGIQKKHNWATNGIDSITFHTNIRSIGPFGCGHGKKPPENIEINFGRDYYLCGIKGQITSEHGRHPHGLGKISFVFRKDFSGILSQSLEDKIGIITQILSQNPSILCSVQERSFIKRKISLAGIHSSIFQLNPYEILGISKYASLSEVKKNYRRLALAFHPDKNLEFREIYEYRFKNVRWAYSTIMSKEAAQGIFKLKLDADDKKDSF